MLYPLPAKNFRIGGSHHKSCYQTPFDPYAATARLGAGSNLPPVILRYRLLRLRSRCLSIVSDALPDLLYLIELCTTPSDLLCRHVLNILKFNLPSQRIRPSLRRLHRCSGSRSRTTRDRRSHCYRHQACSSASRRTCFNTGNERKFPSRTEHKELC